MRSQSKQRRLGFSMLELVVASASAAVLMGGLGASLYIAGQSLEVSTNAQSSSQGSQQTLAMIHRELQSAISMSELTATSVTMKVPDRDADGAPETIRYAWSGTAGDPLTQEYNGGAATTVATDVQSFSLSWLTRLIEGSAPNPNLLFVSKNTPFLGILAPTSSERARITMIEDWGFDVTTISQSASQSDFDEKLAEANVAYVSGEANGGTVGSKLNDTPLGVVTESMDHAGQLGILHKGSQTDQYTANIDQASHYIVSKFDSSSIAICSSAQALKLVPLAFAAPAARSVVSVSSGSYVPSLLVITAGGELTSGSSAAGRRCLVPWGESSFDPDALTGDGQTLMRRTIEWASGLGDDGDGPLAHWKLDDASGATAIDSVGEYDGKIVNGPNWDVAVLGGGLYFDGIDDYIAIESMNPRSYNDCTICAWYKSAESDLSDDEYVFEHNDNFVNELTFGPTDDGTNGRLRFGFASGGSGTWDPHYGTSDVVDEKWHHLVGVRSRGHIKIYVDGVLETDEKDAHAGVTVKIDGDGPFIGDLPGNTEQVHGHLDDVRFYDRALSDTEIAGLYVGGGGSSGSGSGSAVAPAGEPSVQQAGTNTTSIEVSLPKGTAAGDLLIAAVATDGDTKSSLTAPAGWKLIEKEQQASAVTLAVWMKVASSKEPGSENFSWSGKQEAYGWMMRFTGHDLDDPINAAAVSTSSSDTPTSPAVTTTVGNTLILRLGGFDDDDITLNNPGLPGHTSINMGESGTGRDSASGGSGWVMQATAGDSGKSTFSLTAREEAVTITIAIAPNPKP